MGRIIGIQHRVKKTVAEEARPTKVAILENTKTEHLELGDENEELDFILGNMPTAFRPVTAKDDLKLFNERHIKWRKLEKDEISELPETFTRKDSKNSKILYVAEKVPSAYDGFRPDDTVLMVLGGSGDMLAYALSRQAVKISGMVKRISAFNLKNLRESPDKSLDAELLITAYQLKPDLFYEIRPRDANLIRVRECLRARTDVMKARIGAEQRLRQLFIGKVFTDHPEICLEGSIEKAFDVKKASDPILQALLKEESVAERALVKAVEDLDVFETVFGPIEGCGPMIASRIISAIIDIRRFPTKAGLKKYMGAHVLADGRFPRRRNGEIANWTPDARQALYLLGEQFNRRPDSVWGEKLLMYKEKFRAKHPFPVVVVKGTSERAEAVYELPPNEFTYSASKGYTIKRRDVEVQLEETPLRGSINEFTVKGTRRYGNGHIHRMATWRTLTKFVENLWHDWWMMEDPGRFIQPAPLPQDPDAPTGSTGPEQTPPKPDSDEGPTAIEQAA